MAGDRDGSDMGLEEYFGADNAFEREDPTAGASGDDGDDDAYDKHAQQGEDDAAQIQRDLDPIPDGGPLLEEANVSTIFRALEKGLRSQDQLRTNRGEAKKHWDYVLAGSTFSILEKSDDLSVYRQIFPPGVDANPMPIPNKVLDLRKKIISQILVDPFLPDPKPDGADSDKNRGAADLVKAYLRNDAGPAGTHDTEMLLECLNINSTGASAFVWLWIAPMGGGWRPMQKMAHPQATDATKPLEGPKLGPDGQPIQFTDPATGETTVITERSNSPILRFVTEDGQFTKNPAEAARQWVPKARRRVLLPSQVSTFPRSATTFNARAITLQLYETLGEAKERFPILTTLSPTRLKELCAWKPKNWKALVPEALRPKGGDVILASDGSVSDDTLFFWYHHYCRHGASYQDGAELAVTGAVGGAKGGFLLRRDTLREDVVTDDDGTTVPVLLHPPIAQFKASHDTVGGDPFGLAPVAEFGGANEIYAHLYSAVLESIDKGLHPNVYLPSTSPISREDYNRRDGRPLEIMVPEDKPFIEPAPVMPAFLPQMIEKVEMGMNSAAGTNQTSNGLDSSYASSGVAKEVSIRQAKVALAQYYQNTAAGIVFYWMIKTEQARARLTVPEQVQLIGTQSAFKQRWFVGADLIGVARNIPVAAGSGTMMAPMEKLQLVQAMLGLEALTKDQAGELARSNMSDDLGITPDVHEQAMDREIGLWLDGPTPEWSDGYQKNQQAKQAYQQQIQAATQQAVAALVSQGLDPASAQQQASAQVQQQVPPPQLVPLWTPFEPRPNHEEPGVAKTRVRRLSHLISTPDFSEQDGPWRQLATDEYTKAFAAAGGQTVKQQQESAQQQQQAASGAEQPQFAQFVSDVQKKVLAMSEQLIAKEVAAAVGATQPEAQGPDPIHAQREAAADAERTALFDSGEREKDRAHEATQNKHAAHSKMLDTVLKGAMSAHNATQAQSQKGAVAPGGSAPHGQIPPTPTQPLVPGV